MYGILFQVDLCTYKNGKREVAMFDLGLQKPGDRKLLSESYMFG